MRGEMMAPGVKARGTADRDTPARRATSNEVTDVILWMPSAMAALVLHGLEMAADTGVARQYLETIRAVQIHHVGAQVQVVRKRNQVLCLAVNH